MMVFVNWIYNIFLSTESVFDIPNSKKLQTTQAKVKQENEIGMVFIEWILICNFIYLFFFPKQNDRYSGHSVSLAT